MNKKAKIRSASVSRLKSPRSNVATEMRRMVLPAHDAGIKDKNQTPGVLSYLINRDGRLVEERY